ncbi:MAG: hypothetical protein AB8B69_06135 [Chitinophagales bacterium]
MASLDKTIKVKNFVANDLSGNSYFKAEPNGWREYGAIEVNVNGGSLIEKGSFSQVQVYCTPQTVDFAPGSSTNLPGGSSDAWADGYAPTYPQSPIAKWCVVIFQVTKETEEKDGSITATVNYAQVTATSLDAPQTFNIDSSVKNLYITINDSYYKSNGVSYYGDNSGTFKINVNLEN